jgi:hypothetical protein
LDDGLELRDGNNILKRKVSHFGTNYDASGTAGYNVTHVLAKTIHLVETGSYFAELQGRKYGAMCKVVCDAGAQGEFWVTAGMIISTIIRALKVRAVHISHAISP